MIKTTVVVGGTAAAREEAIASGLNTQLSNSKNAVLVEGLSSGKAVLESDDNTIIVRIAPGCICCSNNMIMRVHLNRLIQQQPHHLWLSLSSDTHLQAIKTFLNGSDYQKLLELTNEINLH